jgi:hypothetical protein
MSTPMRPGDPAYFLLEAGLRDPSRRSQSSAPHDDDCYICRDPEFALMGLPLCFACRVCGAHVAADDPTCGACNHDHSEGPNDIEDYQALTWADDGGRSFESGPWLTDRMKRFWEPLPLE